MSKKWENIHFKYETKIPNIGIVREHYEFVDFHQLQILESGLN